MERRAYPSDVSDDEWAFVAPYLTLMTEKGLHFLAFVVIMLARVAELMAKSA